MYRERKGSSNLVNEPVMEYYSKKSQKPELSNQLTFAELLEDKFSLSEAIKKGVPFMLFQKIQTVAPLSEEDWALFLGISTKTLQRNKTTQNFQFKPIHSEKIFEMAEVMLLGVSVFENKDNFYQWLGLSNTSLGGKTPIELVSNSYGKELVMDCLHRIEHGIFA